MKVNLGVVCFVLSFACFSYFYEQRNIKKSHARFSFHFFRDSENPSVTKPVGGQDALRSNTERSELLVLVHELYVKDDRDCKFSFMC